MPTGPAVLARGLDMSSLLIWGAAFLAWVLVLAPSVYFLFSEWRKRRDQLIGLFTVKALGHYYDFFFRAEKKAADQIGYGKHFRIKFDRRYGKRHYILPLTLLGLVAAIGIGVVTAQIATWIGYYKGAGTEIPAVAVSAFLGGYAWVVNDQLSRFRRQDFTLHDVYACTFRLIVSIPLGFALAAIARDDAGVPIAFLLGAFPTYTLIRISRRVASQKLGLDETGDEGPTELSQLQGMGRTNAERFQQEGFTTVTELAWADPVQLTIRTNFDFNYIVDSVSQALLWVYLGPQTPQLYPLSLRGAQEVRSTLDDLNGDDLDARHCAKATIAAGAEALKMNPDAFRSTLSQVSEDPYTDFLFDVWPE